MLALTVCCVAALAAGVGQTRTGANESAAWIERGQAELDRSHFKDAESALRKAVELDPKSATAHFLLVRAILGQLLPNLRIFPDSEGLLPKAEVEGKIAVELAPADANAWCALGTAELKMADAARDVLTRASRLNLAQKAFERALTADPSSVEAHNQLAEMAFEQAMGPVLLARAQSGVKMGEKGPIRDSLLRSRLRATYGASIETAISHLQQALKIDPKSSQAMHEMGGLLLLRAAMRNEDSEYQADQSAAEEWMRKYVASVPQQPTAIPNGSREGGVIGAILSAVPTVAPSAPQVKGPAKP